MLPEGDLWRPTEKWGAEVPHLVLCVSCIRFPAGPVGVTDISLGASEFQGDCVSLGFVFLLPRRSLKLQQKSGTLGTLFPKFICKGNIHENSSSSLGGPGCFSVSGT